jgi:23S rRNA (uracil1939-C5)-methyltransferase
LTIEEVASDLKIEEPALGFHVPKRFDKIIEINKCFLQDDRANDIRNETAKFTKANGYEYYDIRQNTGLMRNLIIRNTSTNEWMVIVVFAADEQEKINALLSHLKNTFPFITSLLYVINTKKNDTIFDLEILTYHGADFISESMHDLKGKEISFRISPKAFYQTNSAQAYELYKITRDFADLKGDELVYDLYTGAGTIAQFVARKVKKVIGVEYVPTAIEDAKANAELNQIANADFYAGDMKDILTPEFIAQHGKADVVITDPPRAGMHPDVVARLLEMEAEKIVYVSCNAATQARDIALLQEKYTVTRIRPVDMFPQTQHVENVALLVLKK